MRWLNTKPATTEAQSPNLSQLLIASVLPDFVDHLPYEADLSFKAKNRKRTVPTCLTPLHTQQQREIDRSAPFVITQPSR